VSANTASTSLDPNVSPPSSTATTPSLSEHTVAPSLLERNLDDWSNLLVPHLDVTKDGLWPSEYWAPLLDWNDLSRLDVEQTSRSPESIPTLPSSEQVSTVPSDIASSLPQLEEIRDSLAPAAGGPRSRSSDPDVVGQFSVAQIYVCSPKSSIVELLPAAYIWMNCYWIGTDTELVGGYAVSAVCIP
jgi:hypothetical protein